MKTDKKNKTTNQRSNRSHSAFFKKADRKIMLRKGRRGSFFYPSNIQPKLSISQRDDVYEQEADRMADQVVRKSFSPTSLNNPEAPGIQNKCSACEGNVSEEEEGKMTQSPIQLKNKGGPDIASEGLSESLKRSKGGGRALPEQTRSDMESSFNSDFSSVRVHTGTKAIQMNQELGAHAFTNGSDVYFNSGKYSPESSSGKHLLAHELTHVVQQGGGGSVQPKRQNHSNLISRATEEEPTGLQLPSTERNELKRITGGRIVTSASYFRTALLEVKIKIGNMLKAKRDASSALFEIALGFLMPGLGKILGRGLASLANKIPDGASTNTYRVALALLDEDRTKGVFVKATDTARKISKATATQELKSLTGDPEYDAFLEALKKSAAKGYDDLNNSLSTKTDEELGVLFTTYDPTAAEFEIEIENLVRLFENEIKPIGKRTGGAYGQIKARWIEGSRWRGLALTGEGRYFNVGAAYPEFIAWISPSMKEMAISATKVLNFDRVDTVHYLGLKNDSASRSQKFSAILDTGLPAPCRNSIAMEPASGTIQMPIGNQSCPGCHGDSSSRLSPPRINFPEIETRGTLQNMFPQHDNSALLRWIQSNETTCPNCHRNSVKNK